MKSLLDSLNNIKKNAKKVYKQTQLFEFTDHSTKHSESVLKNIEKIIKAFDIDLNSNERYILIASSYLHDIGLIAGQQFVDKQIELPLEMTPVDIRKRHSFISSEIVENYELQKKIGIELDFPSNDIRNIIARICAAHNNIKTIWQLPKIQAIQSHEIRIRLLGSLLYLGDNLHVGRSRVILENLPKKSANLQTRVFWYSYSCIENIDITKSKIRLTFGKSDKIKKSDFEEYIFNPIVSYFQADFKIISEIFLEYQLKPITLIAKVSKSTLPDTDTTSIFLSTAITESTIRARSNKRKKEIEKKIRKRGLIKRNQINNELVILRRWSSYTPRMPQWSNLSGAPIPYPGESRGGGYFLIWNKTGIAIDPGYDFLRNLWTLEISTGNYFELDDIDSAIITHAHDDHSHDIDPLVSLLYKKCKLTKSKKNFHLYSSEGVHIKYERLFSVNDFIKVTDLISPGMPKTLNSNDKFLIKNGIKLDYLLTRHNEIPWLKNHTGVALKVKLTNGSDQISVGFTSDTQFFDDLVTFFRDVDVLLIHFGNVGPPFGVTPTYDKNHLGINGCHDLITGLLNEKPKLFLMDEFGEEEIGNDRINLCDLISRLTNISSTNKLLLPMDIGLRISLPSLDVFCQEHKHFVSFNQIVPHLPPNDDGIVYFCR
jgi:ribonuclease BN (tRNA processing enzyme)